MYSLNNIKGLIFGAAIGDALGFIAEYQSRQQLDIYIKELFKGKLKTLTHRTYPQDYPFGQYSDDTQFSLYLIDNLFSNGGFNAQKYFGALKDAHSKDLLVGLGSNTRKLLSGDSLNTKNSSNGSLMRSYPIGAFYKNEEEVKINARLQSMMSHNHEDSIISSQCYALSVFYLFQGQNKNFLKNQWDNLLKDTSWLNFSEDDFIKYLKNNYYRKNWDYVPPGALVSLQASLYSFYNTDNYKDCLKQSLRLGGDTDTVCSLSCGLMGLLKGFESLPKEWTEILNDLGQNKTEELNYWSSKIYNLHNI